MSEEIAQAQGDIAYWRQRAEQAEADAAAYRQALEVAHPVLDRHEPCGYYCSEDVGHVDHPATATVGHVLINRKAGAKLLAELNAAREIVEALRRHRDAGGEVWRSIDRDFDAYDEATRQP